MNQKGQVVVLLLLVMVVALAIGLSTISRSTIEVSTSRKSEDSSRAFSAAEAGIERAINANLNTLGRVPTPIPSFALDNESRANVVIPSAGLPLSGEALGYDPFGKESFAQFWLVNPDNVSTPVYMAPTFYIYFGDPDINKYNDNEPRGNPQNKPAIEVTTIYWDDSTAAYKNSVRYFDSYAPPRSSNFLPCDFPVPRLTIDTNDHVPVTFYCRVTVGGYPVAAGSFPIMVRVRLLYTNISHPVAIKGNGSDIPKQANIYTSSGSSGEVKRTLEVIHYKAVMPQIFDYVLFSLKDLNK